MKKFKYKEGLYNTAEEVEIAAVANIEKMFLFGFKEKYNVTDELIEFLAHYEWDHVEVVHVEEG